MQPRRVKLPVKAIGYHRDPSEPCRYRTRAHCGGTGEPQQALYCAPPAAQREPERGCSWCGAGAVGRRQRGWASDAASCRCRAAAVPNASGAAPQLSRCHGEGGRVNSDNSHGADLVRVEHHGAGTLLVHPAPRARRCPPATRDTARPALRRARRAGQRLRAELRHPPRDPSRPCTSARLCPGLKNPPSPPRGSFLLKLGSFKGYRTRATNGGH